MSSPLGVLRGDCDRHVLYRFLNFLHGRMNFLNQVMFAFRQFLDSSGHVVQLLEHGLLAGESLCIHQKQTPQQATPMPSKTRPVRAKRFHRGGKAHYAVRPQQFLNFLPLPQGQGSLRPTFGISAADGREIERHFRPSPFSETARTRGPRVRATTESRPGRRTVAVGAVGACSRMRNCGRLARKVLEGLQVRGAAEEIVQDLVLHVRHQLDEHVVGLVLVFDQRILLP